MSNIYFLPPPKKTIKRVIDWDKYNLECALQAEREFVSIYAKQQGSLKAIYKIFEQLSLEQKLKIEDDLFEHLIFSEYIALYRNYKHKSNIVKLK